MGTQTRWRCSWPTAGTSHGCDRGRDAIDPPTPPDHHLDSGSTRCARSRAPPVELRPLPHRYDNCRQALEQNRAYIDAEAALGVWERALQAPPAHREDRVLMHRDLLAGNVIVDQGHLAAVIDWAAVSRGDPARELIAAWTLFDDPARSVFLDAVECVCVTRTRAIGWVLAARINNVAYYANSNPHFSQDARMSIHRAIADGGR